ncbi:MAG TPA: tRNA 4-thiouridine(8) synthase ThiI [Candidatus Moranbacteria bacterium]|nr:tRNA 4-thiouridine(8) synthase ThiI [Candidatus Moranbacteria bacterium]
MPKKYSLQKNATALLLFSGGLDSILAAKILQQAGLTVNLLSFESYFFDTQQAEKSAAQLNLPLIKKNFSRLHLKVVKSPNHGYGKAMNPCIDCHALMLMEAKKIALEKKIDILATGEILGQRPFSQNSKAFKKIEKITNLKNQILRPLSAQLLPETVYEKSELVNRKKLLAISGRSRKTQLELATKFNIQKFPTPAGGCLLTEKEFGIKLRKLFELTKKPTSSDLELIKFGRHYWKKSVHIILGRNKEENCRLEKLKEKDDVLIKRQDKLGPTAFIRPIRTLSKKEKVFLIEKCQQLIWQYSQKKAEGKKWDELTYTIY